ncbi:Lon-insertion domain-containing protein [Marinobacterium aestuariivivens]|uniref:endopeptidase La n=1 Tax=Marinobacterium aestuariivivens TaxID=1698799 RepID=A0ABW2A1S6_9GAMM
MICALCHEEKLLPFARGGIERVIEQSSRYVDDSTRLSLHRGEIVDLLRESNYWARQRHQDRIEAADVAQAVATARHRNSQYAELMLRQMERGTLMIDTEGAVPGQGNGLTVIQMGDHRFGRPARITATARIGSGRMIDIERETKLGGAIHSKGVLILSAFLGNRYARNSPLSLNASLVFEQSYGAVEGDSASALELCTLLSAIAGVPLKQQFAVTGSVNQHGRIQAIGGVNEKIEGFFELCSSRGLSGDQGVIIPAANVEHLTLHSEVVEACRDGHFHIYAVAEIDEMLALLTGQDAGEMDRDGLYPPRTLNGRVQRQLQDWYETARKQHSQENGRDPPPGADPRSRCLRSRQAGALRATGSGAGHRSGSPADRGSGPPYRGGSAILPGSDTPHGALAPAQSRPARAGEPAAVAGAAAAASATGAAKRRAMAPAHLPWSLVRGAW